MTCDANFNQVSLLCHFDGPNGSTAVFDNSAFGLPLTYTAVSAPSNLSTASPKFGPSSLFSTSNNGAYWSYNAGATPAVGSPLDLSGATPFTVEFWINATDMTTSVGYVGGRDWNVIYEGGSFGVCGIINNAFFVTSGIQVNPGTYQHIVLSCDGAGNYNCAVDGVWGTNTSGANVRAPTGAVYVGATVSIGSANGFMDELRITKGVIRYPLGVNFTPPAAPFPSMQCVTADADFPDVSLLLSMDGPTGSTIFTDTSNTSLPIPAGANISTIKNINTLFGSGVATFDNAGSSNEILIPIVASGPLDFTGVDFTVECWINQAVLGATYFGFFGTYAGTAGFYVGSNSAGVLQAEVEVSGTLTPLTGVGGTVTASTWHHVAMVRQGGTYTVYFDGAAALSLTAAGTDATSGNFTVGVTPTVSPDSMTGSIDELRVTKGLARYTAPFTPPTTQFGQDSAVPPADADFANVSLLLNFDSYNNDTGAGGGFTDSSNVGNVFLPSGSPIIDDSQPRFGTGALAAPTNTDIIFTPTVGNIIPGSALDITTGDFTVECWVNFNTPSAASIFLIASDLSSQGWLLRINGGNLSATIVQGGFQSVAGPTGTNPGQWQHVALVRQGNNFGFAVNGVFGSTFTGSGSLGTVNSSLSIGALNGGGFIDEVRITKGVARYTPGTNFTPPLLPFGVAPSGTTVPNVVGQPLATAESNLIGASLTIGTVSTAYDMTIPAGDVVSTNPAAGSVVSIGTAVDIVESLGPPPPPDAVPTVVGLTQAQAETAIVAAGLTVGTVTTAASGSVPAGDVISSSPAAGTLLSPGSSVDLLVSLGSFSTVPNVVGTSISVTAPALLAAAGLVVGVVTHAPSGTVIAGNIISQSPAPSTSVPTGSGVDVVVSSGLPPLRIPDLFEMTQSDATILLGSLGLVVGAVGMAPSDFVPPGTIMTQNPSAGTPAAAGTIVSFVLSIGQPAVGVMFDFEATVISQYANSPTILQLVNNLNQYVDQSTNFANFFNYVWNVDTAVGFGLDIWGKIVGVSRLLHIPNTTDYVGFFMPGEMVQDWQPMGSDQPPQPAVGGAMYTGHNATQTYLLDDNAYRQLILAKAFANICTTTAPAINQILQNLYGPGTAWVLNTGPMSISYNLTFTPTAIQLAILQQSGVIPTPPGVSFVINTGV